MVGVECTSLQKNTNQQQTQSYTRWIWMKRKSHRKAIPYQAVCHFLVVVFIFLDLFHHPFFLPHPHSCPRSCSLISHRFYFVICVFLFAPTCFCKNNLFLFLFSSCSSIRLQIFLCMMFWYVFVCCLTKKMRLYYEGMLCSHTHTHTQNQDRVINVYTC